MRVRALLLGFANEPDLFADPAAAEAEQTPLALAALAAPVRAWRPSFGDTP